MPPDSNVPTIELPTRFGPSQAELWFALSAEFGQCPPIQVVSPSGSAIEPAGWTLLAAFVEARARAGLQTLLFGEAADLIRRRTPAVARDAVATDAAFVQLHPIDNTLVATRLARAAGDDLEIECPELPSSIRRAATFLFEELATNIVQHSHAPATGFGVMSCHPGERRVQISCADAGVGFLASAQRHPEFAGRIADEAEAIALALRPGISFSNSPANAGFGLGFLSSLGDRLEADVWVASGEALFHRRTIDGRRVSSTRRISAWRGAWVCLEARF